MIWNSIRISKFNPLNATALNSYANRKLWHREGFIQCSNFPPPLGAHAAEGARRSPWHGGVHVPLQVPRVLLGDLLLLLPGRHHREPGHLLLPHPDAGAEPEAAAGGAEPQRRAGAGGDRGRQQENAGAQGGSLLKLI